METYNSIRIALIVDGMLLLFAIIVLFFHHRLISFHFKRGSYSTVISRTQKLFLRAKGESDLSPQNKKSRKNAEYYSCILAISYFSLKKYDHFLYHINFLTDDSFEASKQFWLSVYSIIVLNDLEQASAHYAKFLATPQVLDHQKSKMLLEALISYEQGSKEDVYPLLKELQGQIQMPVLQKILEDYLTKHSPSSTTEPF